ncbi:hypothetical protein JVU11DRAFT_1402 [Chiua virens]|nr:hypothetical protein JVU11DRAFT_1402 [Chiua virens]
MPLFSILNLIPFSYNTFKTSLISAIRGMTVDMTETSRRCLTIQQNIGEPPIGLSQNNMITETYPNVIHDARDNRMTPQCRRGFGEAVLCRGAGYFEEVRTQMRRQAGKHLVHIDLTSAAVEHRVRYHLPDDAERLLDGRCQVVNVWRLVGRTRFCST